MATAKVPALWIEHGTLPRRCARHDSLATHHSKRAFYTRTPGWVYPIALAGLLLAAIIASAIRETVKGVLPGCPRCRADRRTFVASVWTAWTGAFVLFFLAAATGSAAVFLLSGLALLGALVLSFCGDHFRVTGVVSKDRQWVDLNGVDSGFASMIEDALRRVAPAEPTHVTQVGGMPGR
jgi:hypothetical protein